MLDKILEEPRPAWHTRLILREITEPTEACAEVVGSYPRSRYQLLDSIVADFLPADTPSEDRRLATFCIIGQALHFKFLNAIGPQLVGDGGYGSFGADRLAEFITRFSLAAMGCVKPAHDTPAVCEAK
jgi:hypothetical protein